MRKLKIDELNRISIDKYKKAAKIPVVIVLDNIRSLNNIGSVFRTADAFRIEKIFLCGITARPPHRDIQKTALGATESVDWEYLQDVSKSVEYLKKQGYSIYAIEQTDSSLNIEEYQFKNDKKVAVIFGNEVKGVSEVLMNMVDSCIEIPQYGTKHSLNISVSAGIIIWNLYIKFRSFITND
jgi:tRNA G18 (ribose-2'-O)-methylase SpoU